MVFFCSYVDMVIEHLTENDRKKTLYVFVFLPPLSVVMEKKTVKTVSGRPNFASYVVDPYQ